MDPGPCMSKHPPRTRGPRLALLESTRERHRATSEGEDHAGMTIHLAHTAQHTKASQMVRATLGTAPLAELLCPTQSLRSCRPRPAMRHRADVRIGIAIAVRYKAYMRTRPI